PREAVVPTISRRLRSKSFDNSGKQQQRTPDILHSSATSILPGGTGGAATPCHSVRSEIAGSTRAARRAGNRLAANAVTASSALTVANVAASCGRTSYSNEERLRLRIHPPVRPKIMPHIVSGTI